MCVLVKGITAELRSAIKTNRTQTLCLCVCLCAGESYHCRLRSKQTVHTLSLCTKCSILMFVCVLVAATQLLHVKTTQLLQRKHVLYSVQQQICACKQTVLLLLHEQNRRGGGHYIIIWPELIWEPEPEVNSVWILDWNRMRKWPVMTLSLIGTWAGAVPTTKNWTGTAPGSSANS